MKLNSPKNIREILNENIVIILLRNIMEILKLQPNMIFNTKTQKCENILKI